MKTGAIELERVRALTEIPFRFDTSGLLKKARLAPGSEDADEFEAVLGEVQAVAKPKAIYREAYIEHKGGDTVTVDRVTFTSVMLRRNLDKVERIFPFIATCGVEIDRADPAGGDVLRQFWVDVIKEELLRQSIRYLNEEMDRRHALGKTAGMSPGSGDVSVWPIEQQRGLFDLMGDVVGLIGVELTDSFLMIPNKSVSGIRYAAEIDFRTCQVCRRENCPSRSALLDDAMWASIQKQDTRRQ